MRGPFCESADVPDEAYDDGKLAARAAADLRRLRDAGEPFFYACGFWKPHLPFNAPKKYWDLYDREKIPLPPNRSRPKNLPAQVRNSSEIRAYARVSAENARDETFLREVRHGYYACLSYVDAQIGKVLDALDALGLADSTIVVLLGDHGWNLGEHGFIGKHNLMDTATRVPLIIRVPGKKTGETAALTEFVDLYPALCDLCGIPQPENQLDGSSFARVFDDLSAETKDAVYIQWEGGDNAVSRRFSYAEWRENGKKTAAMLFDHDADPREIVNGIGQKRYAGDVAALENFIRKKKTASEKQKP